MLSDQILQIVPVGALPTMLGRRMTYRVLYHGKPIAGATVINDAVNDPDAKPVRTGVDGRVTLVVRNQGLNVVKAVFDGPTDDPRRYDHIENTATLSFVLDHAPE